MSRQYQVIYACVTLTFALFCIVDQASAQSLFADNGYERQQALGFADVVKTLEPSPKYLVLAKTMFRRARDARLAQAKDAARLTKCQIADAESQIEGLLSYHAGEQRCCYRCLWKQDHWIGKIESAYGRKPRRKGIKTEEVWRLSRTLPKVPLKPLENMGKRRRKPA